MLIDSHCHLDKLNYNDLHTNVADVLKKAKLRGVEQFLTVGVTLDAFPNMMDLIKDHPEVHASCGIHPLDVDSDFDLSIFRQYAAHERVIAIGETGLDYFYQPESAPRQRELFEQQVAVAVDYNKPLIIHTRQAREDTLAILKNGQAAKCGGVIHCFTEDWEFAEAAIDLGFYISISGIVTFNKAAELKDVVRRLPLERLLIETDSPYLAPVPFRGKENQPAYVREVAEYIGLLKGKSFDEVAKITTDNFKNLFLNK
ncbi:MULTISPECIES: TatD family hydrolase [unclassified Aliivibrio]|uniref:TatD family hydrolase n=1 Tax=unclassified Aliivibrio TaxID=2645654 RepID=UPI00080D8D69|nr:MULTISPECIES: YchF/TatD family DNA exonuclease [unclassified Aliivibrio]OCH12758.1 metal-dependent hydrolase [Aliivibrio sp. 1S165]OCH16370.1 metal-dependent hydrolase [Aliivibrio sp. 1S128]OCH28554.1 metal-dependent hydrolase [Aliivibrio sp. 1S175]